MAKWVYRHKDRDTQIVVQCLKVRLPELISPADNVCERISEVSSETRPIEKTAEAPRRVWRPHRGGTGGPYKTLILNGVVERKPDHSGRDHSSHTKAIAAAGLGDLSLLALLRGREQPHQWEYLRQQVWGFIYLTPSALIRSASGDSRLWMTG